MNNETARKSVMEYDTPSEHIAALEERLRRQKKTTNEVIAFANTLEATIQAQEERIAMLEAKVSALCVMVFDEPEESRAGKMGREAGERARDLDQKIKSQSV